MKGLYIRLGCGDDEHDSTSNNTRILLHFVHTLFSLHFDEIGTIAEILSLH
jgi:hypothetical protein